MLASWHLGFLWDPTGCPPSSNAAWKSSLASNHCKAVILWPPGLLPGTEEEFRCLKVMCSNVVTKLCSPFMCQLYLTIKCYVGAEPGPLRVTSGFCCHTDLSLFLRFHFSCLPPNRQLVLHSDALDGCKASGVGEENSRRAFLPGFPSVKSCRSIWGDLEEVKPEAFFLKWSSQ